ncbi:MAG: M14 family zinc carboxypeptidase [Alphaproteobacteria bacterium]|nr:M14 family zinc carboxypeptidase [Alphaproteobacteria bacterium]
MAEEAPLWICLEAKERDQLECVLKENALETRCCGGTRDGEAVCSAHVEIDAKDFDRLCAAAPGLSITVEECELASLDEVGQANRFARDDLSDQEIESILPSDGYLNVDEVETALCRLSDVFPHSSERILLPNRTLCGRESGALRIGTKAAGEAPALMVLGGVHAREWIPPELCVYLAADLLMAHRDGIGLQYDGRTFSADDVMRIVESLELVVFPCVNPDGRAYSQNPDGERDWRTNRNVPQQTGEGPCYGIDVNRNFDFLWKFEDKFEAGTQVGVSKTACGTRRQIYRGGSPMSEPETQNVVFLVDEYHRNRGSLRWFIDIHTFGPRVIHRWNHAPSQHIDPDMNFDNPAFDKIRGDRSQYCEFLAEDDLREMQDLAQAMKEGIASAGGTPPEVIPGIEFNGVPVTGLSDDYVFSRHLRDRSLNRVLSFTLELSNDMDKHQPPHRRAMEIVREGSAGVLAFCLAAIDQFEGCS